jgi:hypothetical protein
MKSYLTEQELFNESAKHLLTQNTTAILKNEGAAYRQNGKSCPIGHLIHDKDYSTAIESVPVRYLNKQNQEIPHYMFLGVKALKKALENANINTENKKTIELLSKLQNVHDAFGTWEWIERLTSIANEHQLDKSILKK